MSAAGNKAVFLSYASQDAEAARHICDALRSEGVEVWFDADGGLEHGDEWDAKIRKQIKECVLFIPIISANTQARHEGYFRLEWELAAQRAMSIASGVAFILPVVIDETREPEALVPDRFRMVQWTKLPGGIVTPDVKARYLKLWSHRIGLARARASAPTLVAETSEPLSAGGRRRGPAVVAAAVIAALAITGFGIWRVKSRPGSATGSPAVPAPAPKMAGSPEVQAKLRQMWQIFEKNNDASREDWALAEELGASVVKLENNNADAWAAFSVVTVSAWFSGYDFTEGHFANGMTRAERALSLAPNGIDSRFAYANCLRMKPATRAEAERMLRELVRQVPTDKRILRTLAATLRMQDKFEEALAVIDRAIALPGGDVAAMFGKIAILRQARRETEAQVVIDQILAVRESPYAYLWKAFFQVSEQGDLDQARAALEKIPATYLLKDDGAYFASRLWLWRGDYDRSIAAQSQVAQDFLLNRFTADRLLGEELRFFLTGQAHQLAGRKAAAEIDWRSGLKKIEQRLAAEPGQPLWYFWKARLLASLGETAEGERALEAFRELAVADADTKFAAALVLVPLGRGEEALTLAADATRDPAAAAASVMFWRAMLRFDPTFAALRGSPRFDALVTSLYSAGKNPRAGNPEAKSPPVEKSVAVLPFANLSGDPQQDYFSDGLTEEILTALSNERDLHVPGRTSAFAFKGKPVPVPEIARALNVAQVVEGSVRKSGDQVKITVSLTRASDGFSEPLGSFTEKLEDIFALQEKVARAVVEKLTQRHAVARGGTVLTKNAAAYDRYLRARASQISSSTVSPEARRLLAEAVKLDPEFAVAWARLAEAQIQIRRGGFDRSEQSAAGARDAANQALRLNPSLPEAHLAMASVALFINFDHDAAERELDQLQRLRPNDPESPGLRALLQQARGQWDDSLVTLTARAVAVDPQNAYTLVTMGQMLNQVGQFHRADAMFLRSWELSPDATPIRYRAGNYLAWTGDLEGGLAMLAAIPEKLDHGLNHAVRGTILAQRGELEAAMAEYQNVISGVNAMRAPASGPQGSRNFALVRRAQLESTRGRAARATELFAEALPLLQQYIADFPDQASGPALLAVVHALRAEKPQARAAIGEAMRIAMATHDAGEIARIRRLKAEALGYLGETAAAVAELRGLHEMGYGFGYRLRTELEWEPLRGDPKFQQLLKEAEARADAQPRPKK